MSKATMATAVAAIRDAIAAEKALASAMAGARSAWSAAYVASKHAAESGDRQADIGKASGVSAPVVGDMITAAIIPASAWDVLDTLPARQGRRFTSLHSLIGGARKATSTSVVRAIIADAASKAAAIPRVDGSDPDPAQLARVWGACVRKLWDASGTKRKADTTPPADPPADPGEGGEGGASVTPPADPPADVPPTLTGRLSAIADEARSLVLALTGGGEASEDAMHAAMRECGVLTRTLADTLAAGRTSKASKAG